jgi:hypothetical protein
MSKLQYVVSGLLFLAIRAYVPTNIPFIRPYSADHYSQPVTPQCTYCTGADLRIFWQIGCAQYVQEQCDLARLPRPICGASAGSIVAAFLLARVDFEAATEKALDMMQSAGIFDHTRPLPLVAAWGPLLRRWMEDVIPKDIDPKLFKDLSVAITPFLMPPKLVSDFHTRADVIEACLASSHIPVFIDGRPFTKYRCVRHHHRHILCLVTYTAFAYHKHVCVVMY